MKFTLKIKMDNAAFEDALLLELKQRIERIAIAVGYGHTNGRVIDSNGNLVGDWKIK